MRAIDLMAGIATGLLVFFALAWAFKAFGRNGLLEFSMCALVAVVVAVLIATRRRYPLAGLWGPASAVAVVVASALAFGVNRFQLARWPEGCLDKFSFPMRSGAADCMPPNLADVPLPWLGPMLGLAAAVAVLTWLVRRLGGSGVPA